MGMIPALQGGYKTTRGILVGHIQDLASHDSIVIRSQAVFQAVEWVIYMRIEAGAD
jgi:hypothetical protein